MNNGSSAHRNGSPSAKRVSATTGTGACTATNHAGENLRTPARQYPQGRLTRKVTASAMT
jgi:hypothetical protein